jgi:hypothetical protein
MEYLEGETLAARLARGAATLPRLHVDYHEHRRGLHEVAAGNVSAPYPPSTIVRQVRVFRSSTECASRTEFAQSGGSRFILTSHMSG